MNKGNKTSLHLLRVISIIFVLALHYMHKNGGGFIGNSNIVGINLIIVNLVTSICIVAVNIFVLSSAYFMVDRIEIKIRKIIDIICVVVFHAFFIFFIVLFFDLYKLNLETIKIFINSIINYWFIIIYILLYIFIPYLNHLINNLNKKELKFLILISVFFFCFWPTFINNIPLKDGGYGIVNFILLYFIGSYIKRYADNNKHFSLSIFVYFLSTLITFLLSFIAGRALNYNSIFVMMSSVSLFMIFKNINMKEVKIIKYLSSFSLGIYILHSNPLIAKYIYQDFFMTPKYYNNSMMIFHLIFTVSILYILCSLIDCLRKKIFVYTIDKWNDKIKLFNKTIKIYK